MRLAEGLYPRVLLGLEGIGGGDDRNLEADARAELAKCLAEPVIVHAAARLPEQMPTACLVVAPVLAGAHALEEANAVAPHQPERLKKLAGETPRCR